MTRPGFVIPNANLVAPDYQAAQPDQGDFLVLGNEQYGVITGCKAVLSFPTISLTTDILASTAHILVCAGRAYLLQPGVTANLAAAGAQGRWDLIVFDSKLGFRAVSGTPADNPAFPDISGTMTLLAAVSVPAAASGETPTLIDKRQFLPQTLVADASSPSIVRTYDTTTPTPSILVNIDGHGKINWDQMTSLEEKSPGVLLVTSELDAAVLRCDRLFVGGIEVTTAADITWGTTPPPAPAIGDIFVNNATADITIWKSGTWTPVATNIPSGSVISSFLPPAQMPGWLALMGQAVALTDAGNLPSLFPAWVTGGTITMPDMRGRLPVGGGYIDSGSPGFVNGTNPNGTVVDDHGTVQAVIGIPNMPAHVHQSGNISSVAGSHQHQIPIWAPFQPLGGIVSNYGTANTNGAVIDSLTSTRFAGDHSHTLPAHVSVGGGLPLPVTPPTLGLYFYIKT